MFLNIIIANQINGNKFMGSIIRFCSSELHHFFRFSPTNLKICFGSDFLGKPSGRQIPLGSSTVGNSTAGFFSFSSRMYSKFLFETNQFNAPNQSTSSGLLRADCASNPTCDYRLLISRSFPRALSSLSQEN